jgi:hypothetical protein
MDSASVRSRWSRRPRSRAISVRATAGMARQLADLGAGSRRGGQEDFAQVCDETGFVVLGELLDIDAEHGVELEQHRHAEGRWFCSSWLR